MRLNKIFTDNMVFQANLPIRIFGEGAGTVAVTLGGNTHSQSFVGASWLIELPPMDYGGPYKIKIVLNGDAKTLKNVYLGDVIICAGQSNMQFKYCDEVSKKDEVDNPLIRYYVSDKVQAHDGIKSADGWLTLRRGEVGLWSALALHIAEGYQARRGVAVGIIGCFQGASVIRSWLPPEMLDDDVYLPIELRHQDSRLEKYAEWNVDSILYERTFAPLAPFAARAVVWYQGESNTTVEEGSVYPEMLTRLIKTWRRDLALPELPFVLVEICDYDGRCDDGWRTIQRCQREVASRILAVTLVTSSDVCEHANIHPENKERLAEKIVRVL
ncbi:MAG: hypothetical protein J6V09_06350 [Clostridia bacterium]|nr:hypothetical protein [Clostridia bacterium]